MAKPLFCPSCGHLAAPRTARPGTITAEILLWGGALAIAVGVNILIGVLVFVIAFVYSMWRLMATQRRLCRECDAEGLIPPESPIARRALAELGRDQGGQRPAQAARPAAPGARHEVVHTLPARTGGTYRLIATRELPEPAAKATVADALQRGVIHEPGAGQVATLRAH